ncbi:MAG TPA: hypothetical protein LFW20_00760 [Rickettsia endosymbiont of Omalisus fontisbellaquei]|nr:hypothetical protein [Rickettsia endosymbiont of Omalisus fontisbellaquei]
MCYSLCLCHSRIGGNLALFAVIPWLDHGIQSFFIFYWIPRSSRGMTVSASIIVNKD